MATHVHFKTAERHAVDCYVGVCPACGERVLWDEPDGPVWTCPRDLADTNPYRDFEAPYSEARMERDGVFSQCGENHGDGCVDRLPLHAACYERGTY